MSKLKALAAQEARALVVGAAGEVGSVKIGLESLLAGLRSAPNRPLEQPEAISEMGQKLEKALNDLMRANTWLDGIAAEN